MKFKGTVWRHVPREAFPLHVGFILKARGRWNREGEYGCIYTSLKKKGARAEYHKYLQKSEVNAKKLKPRELVSIEVEISPIVDLTVSNPLSISPKASFLIGDRPDDLESCRTLADSLRAEGYAGIIVPSASCKGEKNLIIYTDGPPRNLSLEVGGERIPL